MKQAQRMQEDMKQAQDELAKMLGLKEGKRK